VFENKFKKGQGPSIKILYTITPETIRRLATFKEFFRDQETPAVNIIFQHFMFIDPQTYKKQCRTLSREFGVKNAVFSRGFVFPGSKGKGKRPLRQTCWFQKSSLITG